MRTTKKLLSLLLALCMVVSLLPATALAAEGESTDEQTQYVLPDGVTPSSFEQDGIVYTVYDGEKYYETMKDALAGIHKSGKHELWCKPEADVGTMTHGHVCASLTVYGNDAYISGGERDFELEQYSDLNETVGTDWDGEVTLKVYNLNGASAWGTRHSANTLNIYMENCDNMNRVYLNGATGPNNISLKNCTFVGTLPKPQNANNCTVYSNAGGIVDIQNCTFTGISEPINMNTKEGASEKTINVTGCTFTDCGLGNGTDEQWAAPIRIVNSAAGICKVNVKDCTFSYAEGNTPCNGDILIGDGRITGKFNDVTLNVSGTWADVQLQKPGYYPNKDTSKLNEISVKSSDTLNVGLVESFAVAKVGDTLYATLKEAVEKAPGGSTIILLKDITVSNPIQIDKSIAINGNGHSITRTTNGMVMNVLYQDGIDVTITNLMLKGNNPGGLLEWTMQKDYKENDNPTVTPKLTVEQCTFSSNDGKKTGAGIGLWGYQSNDWFNKAKSEVVINNCTFDTLSAGIYYNEEAPLLNLKSTVTNNKFCNLSWTGIAGIPANAEIAYNTFESSCQGAIQYLLNEKQTKTNTSIHDNVIDSVVGIEFMPYHLNEHNQNGNAKTVEVTKDMLPSIKRNIRNTDTDLVKVVAYRAHSDETLKLAENTAIDLTENYTQGKAPTIETVVQLATGDNTAPTVDKVTPAIKNDVYYEADTMKPEDLNTYVPTYTGPSGYAVKTEVGAHGKLTVSSSYATKGTTVTVTVTPDKGYVLSDLTVTDKNGNALTLTDKGNGKYTFIMPDGAVTVKAAFGPESLPFTDVSVDAYYANAVKWAVDKGVTSGLTATTFGPNESCTRAQMVTFLWRAAGSPVVNYAMKFTDVPVGAYYAEAVRWAVSKGITAGLTETTFGPEQTVTRGQVVAFLYRQAGSPAVGSKNPFTDVASDAYYADAVKWAVAQKITAGTTDTTFSPNADCTRGQIVTFLYNDMAK